MKKLININEQVKQLPLHTRPTLADEYEAGAFINRGLYTVIYTVAKSRMEAIIQNIEDNYMGETAHIAIINNRNDNDILNGDLFVTENESEIHEVTIIAVDRIGTASTVYYIMNDEVHMSEIIHVIIGEYEEVKTAVELEHAMHNE